MRRLALLSALLLAAAAPEPKGIWPGPMQGGVPATLAGGVVVHTHEAAALAKQAGTVIVDVAEPPRRPQGLAPGAPWLPLPHRDIPGSIWIPGTGRGSISAELEAYLRSRLDRLTGAARNHPILVYCHQNCWLGWNAAKRVVGFGYVRVFWYPDGIEAWEKAGLPTVLAHPEGPAADAASRS